jgi:hypothetical protein
MKTYFRFCLLLVFGAFFACLGAGIENHRAFVYAKNHAIVVIPLAIKDEEVGAIVIDGTGGVHNSPSADVTEAVAATLPKDRRVVIDLPCSKDQST